MPEQFTQSADGLLIASNAIDPVLAWDGMADMMWPLGLPAPTAAPAIAFSGSVTTPPARRKHRHTIVPPPATTPASSSAPGTITGTYYAYLRYVDARGEVSDLSPLSAAAKAVKAKVVTYTGVQTPASPRAVRRQLLRNTAGQTRVFYIDIDTDDLTSTTFTSSNDDTQLSALPLVSLFDAKGQLLANLHGIPPAHKLACASHQDRLFLAGEEPYCQGSVSLTAGSRIVRGIGTEWPVSLGGGLRPLEADLIVTSGQLPPDYVRPIVQQGAGRLLWVSGAGKGYEIAGVDPEAQTLTLAEAWAGQTDPYADYAIRAAPAERRLLYFSEAAQPGSWPAINAVSVQEDGDDIVGLMSRGSFLYILCRRHTYKLTFQDGPSSDGFLFLSQGRGCANNRSWVVVDQTAYLLDEAGVWSFAGGAEAQDLSALIQDFFDPDRGRGGLAIRWQAARWFHACYEPGRQLLRWFVTLSGSGLPRHALVLEPKRGGWWIEEYPFAIGASCLAPLDGERRVFLGGPGGRVYLLGPGRLDLVDPNAGPAWGAVASAGPCTLTSAGGPFAAGAAGAPVAISAGRGKGQSRRVVAVSGATLTLDRPWLIRPDGTSVFQLGGVGYLYRTGWFRWFTGEDQNARSLEVQWQPTWAPGALDFRLYEDRSGEPTVWSGDLAAPEAGGFAQADGQPDLTADLASAVGLALRRFDSRKERYIPGPRLAAWEAAGFTNEEGLALYEIRLEGVETKGG
jgi:hypothetical protein